MKTKLIGILTILAAIFLYGGCASTHTRNWSDRPLGTMLYLIFEVHENETVSDFPRDCLVIGIYFAQPQTLQPGEPILVLRDGQIRLMRFSSEDKDNLTGFLAKAFLPCRVIDPKPIDLASWDNEPSGVRVFVEQKGVSMKPVIPEHSIIATTLDVSYDNLKRGDIGIYWNYYYQTFVAHRLVRQRFDGSWTMKGDNNDLLDPGCLTKGNFVAKVHQVYEKL